jgi:acyl carrier protein
VQQSGRPARRFEEAVYAVIAAMAPKGGPAVAEDTDLRMGLQFSSLRLLELMLALEQYLGLPPIDLADTGTVATVGDVIRLVRRLDQVTADGTDGDA